jgi:hypothetical protein
MRKSGLGHLILIRISIRAERTLRLCGPTITWRRGITRNYRVTLFLGRPRGESANRSLEDKIERDEDSRDGVNACKETGWLLTGRLEADEEGQELNMLGLAGGYHKLVAAHTEWAVVRHMVVDRWGIEVGMVQHQRQVRSTTLQCQ